MPKLRISILSTLYAIGRFNSFVKAALMKPEDFVRDYFAEHGKGAYISMSELLDMLGKYAAMESKEQPANTAALELQIDAWLNDIRIFASAEQKDALINRILIALPTGQQRSHTAIHRDGSDLRCGPVEEKTTGEIDNVFDEQQ